MTVGRNDPCPCGSGKKYKNCCMRQDRLESARGTSARGEETALYASMTQYIVQPRFGTALAEGIAMFWRGQYAPEASSAIDTEGVRRMVEWFVIDYRYGSERRRIIDSFIENEGPRFVEPLRQLMDAWAHHSRMGMFRYAGRVDDEHLRVYDPLEDRHLTLRSRLLAQNARPNDVLVGRVYALDGEQWLTMATLILPREFEQPMAEYVRNAYRVYTDEHPGASWEQFLGANGHLFNAFLLSDRAEGLRGLIGPRTRFRDPAATRDKMREITREKQSEQAGRDLLSMGDLEPQMNVRRSSGGIVLPGAEAPEATENKADAPQKRPTILIPGRDV